MTIAEQLTPFSIGIAGCGGLGSNCAIALARVGIGRLVLADFDVVELSNLNRQYYFRDQIGLKKVEALKANIHRINPEVRVESHPVKLAPEDIVMIFADCDVVVEAFDLKEMKLMIAETMLEHFPDKPLILGSGLAGWGNNDRLSTKRSGHLVVCGDESTETTPDIPPLAPRVGIVANMQANIVLEILLGKMD